MAKRMINFRLDEDRVTAVDQLAADRGWSRTQWITRAVERVLESELAKQPVVVPARIDLEVESRFKKGSL